MPISILFSDLKCTVTICSTLKLTHLIGFSLWSSPLHSERYTREALAHWYFPSPVTGSTPVNKHFVPDGHFVSGSLPIFSGISNTVSFIRQLGNCTVAHNSFSVGKGLRCGKYRPTPFRCQQGHLIEERMKWRGRTWGHISISGGVKRTGEQPGWEQS